MQFIWRGRRYTVHSLGPALDEAFLHLYAAFESGPPVDLAHFSDAVATFLDAVPAAVALHDNYFTNFTILWSRFFHGGQYHEADALCIAFTTASRIISGGGGPSCWATPRTSTVPSAVRA